MNDERHPADVIRGHLLEKGVTILMDIRGYTMLEHHRTGEVTDITALDPRSERQMLIRIVTAPVSTARIRTMVEAVETGGFHQGILVAQKLSSSAKRAAHLNGIELFSEEALPPFNIFDHELVPKHELLSETEALKVLNKYRVKPYRFPHVYASDPAIRLLGGKAGDIVKITRKSPTAGKAIAYRCIV